MFEILLAESHGQLCGYLTIDTGLCPYPRVPTPSHVPLKRVCKWLCCLALDPGLLTSDEDERSEECEAEEEGFSQKPQASTRASTNLPLINLSSRPMSESQSSPNALRTIQKPHRRVV
ncbi:hypothetical protein BCON_0085g00330 [Botryotinia convoluta]|uniref:Uncharacterized protein n=1 Tax=Botryotinia convoluta TaxID=54673 RepID=A0A4Z1I2W1_9HELO|nr:hypothetical protein BCON_0085g00330 [Botryotinia convoluta]